VKSRSVALSDTFSSFLYTTVDLTAYVILILRVRILPPPIQIGKSYFAIFCTYTIFVSLGFVIK